MGGNGTDQLYGRILAGNDITSTKFSVLPPPLTKNGLRQVAEIGWHKFIAGYDQFPEGFRKCIPMFLASILYHIPKLQRWYPGANHEIWGLQIFNVFGADTIPRLMELRGEVVMERQRCADCHMCASGVPSRVDVMKILEEAV